MTTMTPTRNGDTQKNDDMEIIHVVHNEGEEKPWEVVVDDVSLLKKIRAMVNYPGRHFETEEKAIEVAEMLRDIIKADAVEVEGEPGLRDGTEKAPFFHNVQSEDDNDENQNSTRDDEDSSRSTTTAAGLATGAAAGSAAATTFPMGTDNTPLDDRITDTDAVSDDEIVDEWGTHEDARIGTDDLTDMNTTNTSGSSTVMDPTDYDSTDRGLDADTGSTSDMSTTFGSTTDASSAEDIYVISDEAEIDDINTNTGASEMSGQGDPLFNEAGTTAGTATNGASDGATTSLNDTSDELSATDYPTANDEGSYGHSDTTTDEPDMATSSWSDTNISQDGTTGSSDTVYAFSDETPVTTTNQDLDMTDSDIYDDDETVESDTKNRVDSPPRL